MKHLLINRLQPLYILLVLLAFSYPTQTFARPKSRSLISEIYVTDGNPQQIIIIGKNLAGSVAPVVKLGSEELTVLSFAESSVVAGCSTTGCPLGDFLLEEYQNVLHKESIAIAESRRAAAQSRWSTTGITPVFSVNELSSLWVKVAILLACPLKRSELLSA